MESDIGYRGVVDTITAGFDTVNRRLFLVVLPIALDLVLWLGPTLPVTVTLGFLEQSPASLESPPSGIPLVATSSSSGSLFDLGELNLIGLLSFQIPGVIGLTMSSSDPVLARLEGYFPLVLIVSLLVVGGVGVASIYFGAIAHVITRESWDQDVFLEALPRWTLAFGGYILLLFFAVLFIFPVSLLVSQVLTSVNLQAIFLTLIIGLSMAAFLYLFFADSAIFLSNARPFTAVKTSALLVANNFLPSLTLFLLFYLILFGTSFLWGLIRSNPVGIVGAIAANSYITTGLTSAAMIFYQDRVGSLTTTQNSFP